MHTPSEIILQKNPPTLSAIDFDEDTIANKAEYTKQLKKWQHALVKVQQAYFRQGRRVIINFEGWDAAGKGGVIRRITEKLDPRGFQVHPIAAPTPEEQGHHYLYRFMKRLPKPGTIAIFDRSYYGRVLVERIEGFSQDQEWQRAYQEINEFERILVDDNVRIIKFFLHISPEEQLKRFELRLNTPHKQWKLTEEDIRNRLKWKDYELAIEDMFQRTSTESAPWYLIPANHKWTMRIKVLKSIIKRLEENVDISPPPIDPDVVAAAKKHLGLKPS